MDIAQIITISISVAALLLSVLNFYLARKRERLAGNRQARDDKLQADKLLDEVFELLWGKHGFTNTRDKRKLDDAESAVKQAKSLCQHYPRAIEYEGHIFEVKGNIEAAREFYEKSLSLDPSRSRVHECLGLIAEDDECIPHFEKAIECDPLRADNAYHLLGQEMKRQGRIEEAKVCYQKSLSINSRRRSTLHAYAKCLQKDKQIEEAREYFEKSISADSSSIDSMVSLGAMLAQNDAWDEGISWIEHAMHIEPQSAHPYAMIAALYADKGDPENALKYNERATQLDPTRKFKNDVSQDLKKAMEKLLEKTDNDAV